MVKTRTICFEVAHCLFLLLFAIICKGSNCVQVIFSKSLLCLKTQLEQRLDLYLLKEILELIKIPTVFK